MDKLTILNLVDYKVDSVHVAEWNATIYVRTMSGASRDMLDKYIIEHSKAGALVDPTGLRVQHLIACVCDEQGKLLFDASDAKALQDKNANAINTIFEKIKQVNGLGDEAIEEAKKN